MVVYDLLVSLSKESIDVLRFIETNLAAFNQQYIFFNIQRKNSIMTPLLITPQQEKISQIVEFLMDEYNKSNRRPGPPREQPMPAYPLLPYQQSSEEQPMMPYQQPPGDDDQPYDQIYHKKHASQQVNTELSDYYQHILALGDEDKGMDSMLKLPERAKRESDDEDDMFPIKKLTT
ncbi:pH171R [African swine fever virus]|uniref:PH171R n=1 Tax=African swine fever virus TaxID=10497 RepID=A0A2Z5DEU5_ASF|nr:pH171R [African swine fever virus]AXB49517.1 pH171R [African swine fever virus]AXB49689.1 pH171R [African swine fever virus]AXB49860.1 pH171R [African swine fever virus]AXB50033.1 pH171R [African swine fever virus]